MRSELRPKAKGRETMAVTIRAKRVSYGLVELKDNGPSSPRYAIYVNGQIKEISDNLDFMIQTFDQKYN